MRLALIAFKLLYDTDFKRTDGLAEWRNERQMVNLKSLPMGTLVGD